MRKYAALLFLILLTVSSAIRAQDFAVSVKASTVGCHFEAFRSFGSSLNLHLGGSFFAYKYNSSENTKEDYVMNADLKLNMFSLLLDYMPFKSSSFRISAGAALNNNKPNAVAVPTINKVIGGDVYNKDNLGNMSVDLSFNKINPYLGIGFGNPVGEGSPLTVMFDIGAYYQGSPKVDLKADGLLAPSASPEQEKIVENNIKWFQFFPVISVGLSYKL